MIFIGQRGDDYADRLLEDYKKLTNGETSLYRFCVSNFPGGEYKVRLVDKPCEVDNCMLSCKNPTRLGRAIARGEDVVLVTRGKYGEDWNSDKLFGMTCQAIEILKGGEPEYFGGKTAKRVCLVMPHEPFTKQDKLFVDKGKQIKGAIKPLKMNRKILQGLGADIILTVFPHDYRREGWVRKKAHKGKENRVYTDWKGLPEKDLSYIEDWKNVVWSVDPTHLFPEYIWKGGIKIDVAISPDLSAGRMCTSIRRALGIWEDGIRKSRSKKDSSDIKTRKRLKPEKIRGKSIGVIDDWILGGGTMQNAIKDAREAGAKDIHCFAIHGELAGTAYEKLMELGVELHTTDTIDNPAAKISTTEQVAERLKNVFD